MQPTHVYEVRPRKDHRDVDRISDTLPFGKLWYGEPNAISNAIGYAKFFSRSHNAASRVYDAAGNGIETHEQKGSVQPYSDPIPPFRWFIPAGGFLRGVAVFIGGY